jgi:hypothetical protein
MKKFTLILVLASLTFSANLLAKDKTAEIAAKSYLVSLEYSNPGVLNSAMTNIIKLKTAYPDYKYDKLSQKLAELENTNKQNFIGYKAYITRHYLENPERFSWLVAGLENETQFLAVLDSSLQEQIKKTKTKLVSAE